jgi:hypothetical protein
MCRPVRLQAIALKDCKRKCGHLHIAVLRHGNVLGK